MVIVTVGIDLAKTVFVAHAVDTTGKPVLLRRAAQPARWTHSVARAYQPRLHPPA